jgi:hypothetical protein
MTRPSKIAPPFKVTESWAKIFPFNAVSVSIVAELPTRHQISQEFPPVTDEWADVTSVDADLNIQTPDPVRFKFPDSKKLPSEQ